MMKRLGFALPLIFLSSLGAQTAETLVYRAVLSNNNEVPVVAGAASGAATVWLHVIRDASGAIISGSADANVSYTFPGASTITAMHIHNGNSTVNGPVVLPFGIARTLDVTTGNLPPVQTQFPTAAVTLDTVKGMVADPSQFYFNVHTTGAPGGAMRAQLQKADVVIRMSQMRPENEVPAITGTSWTGTGTSITLITRDAKGAITSGYQIFDVKYSGFEADQIFTSMHIHIGGTAAAGPVTIDSGLRGQVPVGANGSGTLHYEAEAVLTRAGAIDSLNALASNPNGVYLNAHTVAKGGGAIRGQLLFTDKSEFSVTLTPDQEVPPVTGLSATATGKVQVFTVRNPDASVNAGVVVFDANARFPPGSTLAATHIHDGTLGANGPVSIDSALSGGPVLVADGTGNIYRTVTVAGGQQLTSLNDLVLNPEKHYWNLHTTANPGGGVRAQLGPPAVPDAPKIAAVVNATLDPTQVALAPGGLFTVLGSNLAKVTGNIDGFNGADWPAALAGAQVTVGGKPARLLYVSPTQINAQVPYEVTTVGQPVVVITANGPSNGVGIIASLYAPAIFGGAVFKAIDGSQVTAANPATAGDSLLIYATGLGPTTPGLTSGQLVPAGSPATTVPVYTTAAVTVNFGGTNAAASRSAGVPGLGGVYQVTATVPAGLTPGTVKLRLQMSFAASNPIGASYSVSNSVDLAVK